MQVQINEQILQKSKQIIVEYFNHKMVKNDNGIYNEQQISFDLLGFMALQILLPILVSLCSSTLYDFLKGKILSNLQKKDIENIIQSFNGKILNINSSLSDECRKELQKQFITFGFTNQDIDIIIGTLHSYYMKLPTNEVNNFGQFELKDINSMPLAKELFNKGVYLLDIKDYQGALTCINDAIEICPFIPSLWNNKGFALMKMENYSEALLCFDRALQINQKFADPWFSKGYCLIQLKRSQEAIIALKNFIKYAPNAPKRMISDIKKNIRKLKKQ